MGADPMGLELGPTDNTCYENPNWFTDVNMDPVASSSGTGLTGGTAMQQHFASMSSSAVEATETPTPWNESSSKALTSFGATVSAADWMKLGPKSWKGMTGGYHPMSWGGNGATGSRTLGEVRTGASVLGKRLFWLSLPLSGYSMLKNRDDKSLVAQGLVDIGLGAASAYFTGGLSIAATLLAVTDAGVNVHGQFTPTSPTNSRGIFTQGSDASSVQIKYPFWYRLSLPRGPSITVGQ
jgi:hypothetical protein